MKVEKIGKKLKSQGVGMVSVVRKVMSGGRINRKSC
jgi:hypothetical protein